MTDKGTILLTTYFRDIEKSETIDIGEFKWTSTAIIGGICSQKTLESGHFCKVISCQPKNEKRTVLWSCAAVGTFARTDKQMDKQSVIHFWNASFGNGNTEFHAHYNASVNAKARESGCKNGGKIFVELIDSFYADLSDPKNPLIADSKDVANFKIDGEELYVPKKMLSAQSSFFAAYFKNHINKNEDSFYDVNELKDLKVEDFVHFIGMIHSFAMHIDEKLVEGLLKLADLFQCKLILQRCVEYLKTAPVKRFSHRKKLQLAEKFKLRPILADIIDKASLEELKEGPWEGEISAFARSLMFLKLRMKDS